MANFQLKSFQQIVAAMAAKMSAETPITDFNDGSVVLTLLEAAAQEDFQQYVEMLNIIRNFSLDTTEGTDLDERAAEYGLTRKEPLQHSGFVTVTDTRFSKIDTKIYAGLPGPTAGSFTLNVDDASGFPTSGSLYVGRGTVNTEGPIAFTAAPVDNTSFWTITLDTALLNDHGTDESIILSQFGSRVIEAGIEVEIPESDFSESILFEINQTVELLDGENTIDNVLVTALEAGGFRVPANSIVSFPNPPFIGAAVTNSLPFVNGRDRESDQELRDRIRDTVQSLSRGTGQSVKTGILGLIDEDSNSSVVSASIVSPVVLADGPTKVYIDNGRGLEPSLSATGLETAVTQATGGEKFFQLDNFPMVKANLVTQNVEPFELVGLENLIIQVGTDEETFVFLASDFETEGAAKGTEISQAINQRSNLLEARTITTDTGIQVIINPIANQNENLRIDSASTANTALGFATLEVATLKLYKNDVLLTKDGTTAALSSLAQPFNLDTLALTTSDGDYTLTSGSNIVTKTVAGLEPFDQFIAPGDYIKVDTDSDAFYIKVRTVVSETKLILEAPYPANTTSGGFSDIVIWNSPQLEVAANGDKDETEIVSFSPNDFGNPLQALASEVFARMDAEINLSKVELSNNNTRVKVLSEKENSSDSKMQILGGEAALQMGFCTVSALTGTSTAVGGSKIVTGSGTLFLSELEVGQWIRADLDDAGSWTKVEAIEDDTTLYLTENYRGEDRAGVAFSKINFSELNQGANKDYTLNKSNGQVELTNPLAAGDSVTAGSINTRGFVDSLPEVYDFDSLGATSTLIIGIDGGIDGTVSTGDASAPYDNFFDASLVDYAAGLFVGFYVEWLSGTNLGESSFISTYDESTGEFTTLSGFTNAIAIGDKFRLCQVINFTHATDFADAENALASEVVTAINTQILGGKAQANIDNSVRIRTSNFGEDGSMEVIGGSANTLLAFSTVRSDNQLTNVANVTASTSDRGGNPNALGYTLGPDQNLVVIFDADSSNKTFSINMKVEGTAASPSGTTTFSDAAIAVDYTDNDYFNDFWVYWTSGLNEGSVQVVTDYVATTGTFTVSDVFPTTLGNSITASDTFTLVPRTAENVVRILNDLNTTTFSIVGNAEVTDISGDFVQLSTKTPGSAGKVFVTGGTHNSIGINIQSIPAGAPINDVSVNSKAGLSKGLLTSLTADGAITTGDAAIPYDTFTDTTMITVLAGAFTGVEIEFLTGANAGFETTIATYAEATGIFTLTDAAPNALAIGDTYRLSRPAFVKDITGTTSPFIVEVNDPSDVAIDASVYTSERSSAIRDRNGLNFSTLQVEGIDGYKYFTNLIQKTQWTIDGLDRDLENYPGLGAAGTQFEVQTPVLRTLKVVLNVTTAEGISLSSISNDISNAVSEYINSSGVGDDIILSEIIHAAHTVDGVFDVEITNLTENIAIADGELATISSSNLVIG